MYRFCKKKKNFKNMRARLLANTFAPAILLLLMLLLDVDDIPVVVYFYTSYVPMHYMKKKYFLSVLCFFTFLKTKWLLLLLLLPLMLSGVAQISSFCLIRASVCLLLCKIKVSCHLTWDFKLHVNPLERWEYYFVSRCVSVKQHGSFNNVVYFFFLLRLYFSRIKTYIHSKLPLVYEERGINNNIMLFVYFVSCA